MGIVFINYRREDAAGEARALYNDLVKLLGEERVFMDVDNIGLGQDFRDVLRERLTNCEVMLTLIGRNWTDVRDASGQRRLEQEGDFVRLEIATALERRVALTPVLVQEARMPDPSALPDDVKALAFRNGFALHHATWDSNVREMVKRLKLAPGRRWRGPVLGGVAVAVLGGAAAAAWWLPSTGDEAAGGESPERRASLQASAPASAATIATTATAGAGAASAADTGASALTPTPTPAPAPTASLVPAPPDSAPAPSAVATASEAAAPPAPTVRKPVSPPPSAPPAVAAPKPRAAPEPAAPAVAVPPAPAPVAPPQAMPVPAPAARAAPAPAPVLAAAEPAVAATARPAPEPPPTAAPPMRTEPAKVLLDRLVDPDPQVARAASDALVAQYARDPAAIDEAITRYTRDFGRTNNGAFRLGLLRYLNATDPTRWSPAQRTVMADKVQQGRKAMAEGRWRPRPDILAEFERMAAALGA